MYSRHITGIRDFLTPTFQVYVRIGLMGQEIDSLIRADEVTMGMLQSVKLQELISKRKEVAKRVRNITENVGQSAQQKLQVCEVCGAYLSRLDTDRRLADHFLGKIHLGYVKMREDYDRLMKNNRTTNANKTATTLPGRRFV